MRFLYWTYRHGGIWPFRILLTLVMPWFFVGNSVARRASLEYLARLYETSGGKTPAPTWRNSFRHFMNFGETLLDKLVASDARENIRKAYKLDVIGMNNINPLLDAGRGGLIITAHIGNLELCRRFAPLMHSTMKLTVLVHTQHTQRFNRIRKSLNPATDIDLIPVSEIDIATAMLLSERIAAGCFVAITGDRIPITPGSATLAHSFLGKDAHFPLGPYILAAVLGCPVLTMFSTRNADGFAVTVRPLADRVVLPRRSRTEAIKPYLDAYVRALSEECLKHPLQWFNFYPFWLPPAAIATSLSNDETLKQPLA
jgi:predicted LPLAT superfamily acyltransferase